jgi:hypothetical protein
VRRSAAATDPHVAEVERLLTAAAPQRTPPRGRPRVEDALSICACVTTFDAPNWLVCTGLDGELAWCRVPDGLEPLDLVDARRSAVGHADPAGVAAWLRGSRPDPWSGGEGWGDAAAIEALARVIG